MSKTRLTVQYYGNLVRYILSEGTSRCVEESTKAIWTTVRREEEEEEAKEVRA